VHNEADSIEGTVREIYTELAPRLKVGFIVCEDGSKDATQEYCGTSRRNCRCGLT